MRIFLLSSGTLVLDHSHIYWNMGPGQPVRFPVYSVLIDHPEGLFLFDSGYHLEHVQKVLPFELPEQKPNETIPGQIELCGFSPDDVTVMVNSHLHFDHVGGNRFVTPTRTLLHTKELHEGHNPEPFEHLGYSDKQWDHANANFETIEGDQELAKGLWLFETPGHTVGHYSLLVTPDSGRPLLFTFDAAYTPMSLEREINASFHYDPVAGVRSMRRVKALAAERNAHIFFSHDAETYATYKVAPEYYEG